MAKTEVGLFDWLNNTPTAKPIRHQIVNLMIEAWVRDGDVDWHYIDNEFVDTRLERRSVITLQPERVHAYGRAIDQINRDAVVSHGLYYIREDETDPVESDLVIVARLADWAGIVRPHIICWAF